MTKYKSKSKRLLEAWQSELTGKWHFRVYRRENREILASGESNGYSRKIDCIATAKLVTGGRLKVEVIK